jgi:hypothetical protein
VFTRDDATGGWSAVTLAQDRPAPDFLPQIRSFATHRDRTTGADLVFAGEMPRGIFAGNYDPAATGRVRWSDTPELDASAVSTAFSGLAGRLRVSSFAEANGRLYAALGQQIYERIDGPAPQWRLVYTNPRPGHSETGLRGLTAIPSTGGESLLAAVEGNAPRLVRITPSDGREITELDLDDFLARAWGMRPAYVIAAYNDMARIRSPGRGDRSRARRGRCRLWPGRERRLVSGALARWALRPAPSHCGVRSPAGGDAVSPRLALSGRRRCYLLRRL